MNLFGKKKKQPIQQVQAAPSIMDSIRNIDNADITLEKREIYLDKQIKLRRDQAKDKLRSKDKKGALRLLSQCKQLESEIDRIGNKRNNLSQLKLQLEAANANRDIINAFRGANEAIKHVSKPEDVDNIDDIMNELNEGIAQVNEIDDALTQPIGMYYIIIYIYNNGNIVYNVLTMLHCCCLFTVNCVI